LNTLVLARYREDLDWIAGVPEEFNIYIYNKGESVTSSIAKERATEIVDRPNFGRQSETYIYHLLRTKTEDLDPGEYMVFSQGDPFESSPDFLKLLNHWRSWESVQPLSWRKHEAENIPPLQLLDLDKRSYLQGLRLRTEQFSLTTLGPLQFLDFAAYSLEAEYRSIHQLSAEVNIISHFFFLCGLDDMAVQTADYSIGSFAYNGIFAAQRDRLARLQVQILNRMHTVSRSRTAYDKLFERIWLHLFGYQFEAPLLQPV
jgi:hypothetical protein